MCRSVCVCVCVSGKCIVAKWLIGSGRGLGVVSGVGRWMAVLDGVVIVEGKGAVGVATRSSQITLGRTCYWTC